MNNFTKGALVRKDAYYGNVIKVFKRQSEVLVRWQDDPGITHQFSVEKMQDVTLAYSGSHDASLLNGSIKN